MDAVKVAAAGNMAKYESKAHKHKAMVLRNKNLPAMT